MQLRSGRMLFDAQQFGYFLVRPSLEHIEVEHRTATIGQLGHKPQQFFFAKAIAQPGYLVLIGHVGQLLFGHHQPRQAFTLPDVVNGLRHHHPRQPRAQPAFAPKGKAGEDLDKTVVQHIVRGVQVTRIAVAHRQHLFGITGVQCLPGTILACPASFHQLYFSFQIKCCFLYGHLFVPFFNY